MPEGGLSGKGLLQSPAEWEARNTTLADTLSELIAAHTRRNTGRILDVGTQTGALTAMLASRCGYSWWGIDPAIEERKSLNANVELLPGSADRIPFPDAHFDAVVLANVFEHISPPLYQQSLREIRRVLAPGGVLVGQVPNPYFPIESHSRLPFMGWLPYRLQLLYWRLSPAPWQHDFYVVTARGVQREAERAGFERLVMRNFNYPLEVIPRSVRWAARLLERPMRVLPWAWQFVFRAP